MAEANREQRLGGGRFYGSIQQRCEQYGAIFTDLRHGCARKLPPHSHELPFFALLLEGDYFERYGRRQNQFGPFTIAFRPAGIPHQDEIGPRGLRFFDIELRPSWAKRLKDCSGTLEVAYEDFSGGELLWLAMKLFRETRRPATDGLWIETLLTELIVTVARLPRENGKDAPHWMKRILDKIESDHCERLTLDALGHEAGVHPVHLSRVFRRCNGEGICEFVHRLRIRSACEQMLARETTLAEISVATGFADQSHFTRTFRKFIGITPAAFRTMLEGKTLTQANFPPIGAKGAATMTRT